MAGEVVVDALPYIDQGYDDPGVRDAVRNIFILHFLFHLCCRKLTHDFTH